MNFQIGDRIEVTRGLYSDTGVVVGIDSLIAVRMDEFNDIYHDCGGLCEFGHGIYPFIRQLKRIHGISYEDIII